MAPPDGLGNCRSSGRVGVSDSRRGSWYEGSWVNWYGGTLCSLVNWYGGTLGSKSNWCEGTLGSWGNWCGGTLGS